MRARIRTTPQAEAQALAAATWWRTNRLAAPDLFTDELAGALDLIARAPEIGHRYRHPRVPGVRRLRLVQRVPRLHTRVVKALGASNPSTHGRARIARNGTCQSENGTVYDGISPNTSLRVWHEWFRAAAPQKPFSSGASKIPLRRNPSASR